MILIINSQTQPDARRIGYCAAPIQRLAAMASDNPNAAQFSLFRLAVTCATAGGLLCAAGGLAWASPRDTRVILPLPDITRVQYGYYGVGPPPVAYDFRRRAYHRAPYYDGTSVIVPPPRAVYPPPVVYEIVPIRPASCGVYRYWNGESCADARYRPPYVGPRW